MIVPPGPHGILAHYFHDGSRYPAAQGSLSAEAFDAGLAAYGPRLVRAEIWLNLAETNLLQDEVCLTFDDGLREAYKIALPVLDARGLTACWNVYTGPHVGVPNQLEHWRWIRNHGFGGVEAFYACLWARVTRPPMPTDYLVDRRYLTDEDRHFRYWRNVVARPTTYERVMSEVAARALVPWPGLTKPWHVWMSARELRGLLRAGHTLGFHTHSHPTSAEGWSDEAWALEYATSRHILRQRTGHFPTTMSHPCGIVPAMAPAWLKAHGIRCGWGAQMVGEWPYILPRWSTWYWSMQAESLRESRASVA